MRAAILVIDSFGIGELCDAQRYGDEGSNTALHICERVAGPKWPNLRRLGLGNASLLLGNELPGCEAVERPDASFGVMAERSPGKDTTTGHWEIAGILLDRPFHLFPAGPPSFPDDLIRKFVERTGREILGNKAASGTVIIEELGEEHLRSGKPIVYTSGDSVFQIAAHEEVIPRPELYRICEAARELCDPLQVGRVIARPFVGKPGAFTRTDGRRDFSIALPGPTLLDWATSRGIHTVGVGKIGDIFNEQGIAESHHDKGNRACLDRTLALMSRQQRGGQRPVSGRSSRDGGNGAAGANDGAAATDGAAAHDGAGESALIFVNLVDTDMIYGHRRDVEGYFRAVAEIDAAIPALREAMVDGDLLIVTADHGCDPTFRGTDHTREHVPLLAYRKGVSGTDLGIRSSFTDVAATVADLFECDERGPGSSFASTLR